MNERSKPSLFSFYIVIIVTSVPTDKVIVITVSAVSVSQPVNYSLEADDRPPDFGSESQ